LLRSTPPATRPQKVTAPCTRPYDSWSMRELIRPPMDVPTASVRCGCRPLAARNAASEPNWSDTAVSSAHQEPLSGAAWGRRVRCRERAEAVAVEHHGAVPAGRDLSDPLGAVGQGAAIAG